MCGICGTFSQDLGAADPRPVEAMSALLGHRGPDDRGLAVDGPAAFGFRRLSILDLEGGRQPMASEDGQVLLAFNGEIYNHLKLRKELEAGGARFRTRSDAETVLRLYERDGLRALPSLEGMFALAVWDRRTQAVVLARDRMGVKPLYYSLEGGRLAFASELRALLRAGLGRDVDPAALWDYLNYGFVHAPRTVLASIRRLAPGRVLIVDRFGAKERRYHALPGEPGAEAGGARPPASEDEGADPADRLESLLSEAIRSQLQADVPVGVFLSGGVDSSLVAALAVRHVPKLSTFTIGFSGARRGVDESGRARRIAERLGTDHHELILPADVLSRLDDFAACLDEPLADSALLPTFLLSSFARKTVKAVLTGEGADELFAGYDRYKAAYVSELISAFPEAVQGPAAGLASRLGRGRHFARLPFLGPADWAEAGRQGRTAEMQSYLSPRFLAAVPRDWNSWVQDLPRLPGLNGALACDLRTVLADCLLMKVDKASMRASLEARVPFLDSGVVDFALGLAPSQKMRWLKGKFLLRRVAAKHLPFDSAWRPKHGFIVPWEDWLRSRASSAVDDALRSKAVREADVFDVDLLLKTLGELRDGSPHPDAGLFFRVAVFALWLNGLDRPSA